MKLRYNYFQGLALLLIPILYACELNKEDDIDPIIDEPIVEEKVDGGLDTLGKWEWVDLGEIELGGHDIAFGSPDTVYIMNKIFHPFPGLKVSYDGGMTWLPGESQYNIISGYNKMHLIDHNNIFLFGKFAPMLSSSNYSANIYNFNFNDLYNSTYRSFFHEGWRGCLADVGSRGEDVYVLALSSRVTIQGKLGDVQYDLNRYGVYESIAFATDSVGFVGSDEGEILMTSDRNNSWVSILKDPDKLAIVELFFHNSSLGFALTNSNVMYRTTNGGKSWDKIILPHKSNKQDIDYLNKKIVMVNDSRGFTNYGMEVFETTDGGRTWLRTLRVGKNSVNGISYDHTGAIWAVTGAGLLKFELN
ncbi:YCF48-related protein [uncultured Algoriphagus sp.]|uniref:WD40/YVTN/BNR-like repeat-containing protein n=1 Tax=uncultured Algoriphagus sp. TaxID=417365 RepID=UPI0030EB368C|tara:strand:- start:12463 stop:13545 length:1083 start_codon:yes stop_codon:yes gene_type:complete